MDWYRFDTVKGSMTILMEEYTLYRVVLPSSYQLTAELFPTPVYITDNDFSIPLINKIRAYYQGKIIADWGVKTDLSQLPPFYRKTLEYELTIPYGQTMTYGQVAKAVGSPRAARAVGQANRNNPIPLVIP